MGLAGFKSYRVFAAGGGLAAYEVTPFLVDGIIDQHAVRFGGVPHHGLRRAGLGNMNRATKTFVMQFHCGSRGIYTIHRAIERHGLVRLLTRRKTIGRILIMCVLKTGEANLRDIADVEIRMQCGFIGERRGSSNRTRIHRNLQFTDAFKRRLIDNICRKNNIICKSDSK